MSIKFFNLLLLGIIASLIPIEVLAENQRNKNSTKNQCPVLQKGAPLKIIRGLRGPTGHKGATGERGIQGITGIQGIAGIQGPPGAAPTNPLGYGYYFTVNPTDTPPTLSYTAGSWQLISGIFTVLDLTSWNSLYSGGGFTRSGTRLTYTGSSTASFVVRARLGGKFNGSAGIGVFGIGVNGSNPTAEQIVQESYGTFQANNIWSGNGTIVVELNPGDYIEPLFFGQAGTGIQITFLSLQVSAWNGYQ